MIRASTRWMQVAVIAVAVSGAFAAWSIVRAVEVAELPTSEDAVAPGDVALPPRKPAPRASIAATVAADPFSSARQRPAESYRLPGELVVAAPTVRTEQLKVLGTVVTTAGSGFAMCQLGSEPPTIVRVGQKIGVYILKRVARGSATFASPSGEVVIAAPQPGR